MSSKKTSTKILSNDTAARMKNYHHTFELKIKGKTKVRHTLLLNPQSFTQNEQARVNITQTLGGSYVMDCGAGLPTVTISGTTGFKLRYNDDGEQRDGYSEFMHFRNEVYRKFIQTNNIDYTLFWYNWQDKEYWQIQPTAFRLQRSATESLLYRYELNFTCLAEAKVRVSSKSNKSVRVLDVKKTSKRILVAVSSASEIVANLG